MKHPTVKAERATWKSIAISWGPAVAYMAIIFALSSQPKLPQPPILGDADKMHHFMAYFGLGLLAFRAIVRLPILSGPGSYVQTFVVVALYGFLDEFHQSFVPGRDMSGLDWIADTTGVLAALAVVAIIDHYRKMGGRSHDRTRRGKGL